MALDLLLRQGRRADEEAPVDIAIASGRIVEIAEAIAADAPEERLDGRLVIAGFVESHIHLDKSNILDRCRCEQGTLEEAIASVATAKRSFTEADIYARAQRTLEKAIIQGTTRMRTHVEIDPRVGLKGFHAVRRLKRDYEWAIDLQICAFPQEGLTNDPGAEELLVQACEQGADVIGGCPYMDTDPLTQIARIFEIARRFDLDIDFHSSLATNNVLNPFTPFGDCSLIRMANLYANVVQIGGARDLQACFDMITTLPARLMNAAHYGVAVGHPADLVVVDSRDPVLAVAEVAQPLFGLKRGRRSFTRAAATIHRP